MFTNNVEKEGAYSLNGSGHYFHIKKDHLRKKITIHYSLPSLKISCTNKQISIIELHWLAFWEKVLKGQVAITSEVSIPKRLKTYFHKNTFLMQFNDATISIGEITF